jgi:hypothetical protein
MVLIGFWNLIVGSLVDGWLILEDTSVGRMSFGFQFRNSASQPL